MGRLSYDLPMFQILDDFISVRGVPFLLCEVILDRKGYSQYDGTMTGDYMEAEEKLLEMLIEANEKALLASDRAIAVANTYSNKFYILVLSIIISFTIVSSVTIGCYFNATYGGDYSQEITQINNGREMEDLEDLK